MKIIEYRISDNFIHVDYSEPDDFFLIDAIVIDKEKFELFLKMNNKLDYIMDYNEAGEHRQYSGTLSLEEYYEDAKQLESDLVEYIKLKTLSNS